MPPPSHDREGRPARSARRLLPASTTTATSGRGSALAGHAELVVARCRRRERRRPAVARGASNEAGAPSRRGGLDSLLPAPARVPRVQCGAASPWALVVTASRRPLCVPSASVPLFCDDREGDGRGRGGGVPAALSSANAQRLRRASAPIAAVCPSPETTTIRAAGRGARRSRDASTVVVLPP